MLPYVPEAQASDSHRKLNVSNCCSSQQLTRPAEGAIHWKPMENIFFLFNGDSLFRSIVATYCAGYQTVYLLLKWVMIGICMDVSYSFPIRPIIII